MSMSQGWRLNQLSPATMSARSEGMPISDKRTAPDYWTGVYMYELGALRLERAENW